MSRRRPANVDTEKMAYWDDVDPEEAIRVFDKGLAELRYCDSLGEF